MSRALNIDATPEHITATCAKQGLLISAIEALRSGGTRVVLKNAEATAAIAKTYGNKVITKPVQRMPNRLNQH